MKALFRHYYEDENGKQKLSYDWWNVDLKDSYSRSDCSTFALVNPNNKEERLIAPKDDIIKFKGDVRHKYVRCRTCGELMLNKPEVIEKHHLKKESNINCTKCKNKDVRRVELLTEKIKINEEEGTVERVRKEKGTLWCDYASVSCKEAKETTSTYRCCLYKRCKNNGVTQAFCVDPFASHPKINSVFVTEKNLIDNKWIYRRQENGKRFYETPGLKNVIKAVVDMNGIVESFVVLYRKENVRFMYEPMYPVTPFCIRKYGSNRMSPTLHYDMAETKLNAIKNKLNVLYKV